MGRLRGQRPSGGLNIGSPRNQQTNIPGLYAIGECDYQYHGANRLGANSLVACIFSGLMVAPGIVNYVSSFTRPEVRRAAVRRCSTRPRRKHQEYYDALLKRPQGGPNPYKVHAELGQVMTKSATVVRHNDDMQAAYAKVCELQQQAARCSLSDTSRWANQTRSSPGPWKTCSRWPRRSCKGPSPATNAAAPHYKPEFAMPEITATDPAERRREAEAWCDRFEANNRKWLKSTIAACGGRRRAAAELRRRQHQPDSAPAAAVRPGRRRRDRAGLEGTASSREEVKTRVTNDRLTAMTQ